MLEIIAQTTDVERLTEVLSSDGLTAWNYGTAAAIFVGAVVLARVVRYGLARLLRKRVDTFLSDLLGRLAGYITVTLGLVYAFDELGIAVGPILGALGIAGIALAFALQDILENFVAGVILQLRRPFGALDEIESGDQEGTVLSVDARTVTIRTPDGETVHLPSGEVIKKPIINHSELGRRRTTVEIGIAYGSDLAKACELIEDTLLSVDGVHAEPAPQALVTGFGDSAVDIAMRFWHEPSIATRWSLRHDVAIAVSGALAQSGVNIPFPQRTVYLQPSDPAGESNGAPKNPAGQGAR